MRRAFASSLTLSSLALALAGCPSTPATDDAAVGNDGGGSTEDAPVMASCPTRDVPSPAEQMLPCCYRVSQATQLAAPELRLRFISIEEPATSPLASTAVATVLNTSLQNETFNWLFRTTGADADGPIEIETGYGIRNMDGTYTLGSVEYPPVTLLGNLTGENITTDVLDESLQIPIFDETGTMLQIVLTLRSLRVLDVVMSEDRSCVGRLAGRSFTPAATLEGYITVEDARAGVINVPPINSTLCSVIAGELATPMGMMPLCDRPQSTWTAKPDSLCDASGCTTNPAGSTSVCDPDTTCNAWRLLAQFAAVGIQIN